MKQAFEKKDLLLLKIEMNEKFYHHASNLNGAFENYDTSHGCMDVFTDIKQCFVFEIRPTLFKVLRAFTV